MTPIQKFQECAIIFSEGVYEENGISKACRIHDAFAVSGERYHNCLACNFADSANFISMFLEKNKTTTDIQQDFSIYILLLYLLVERIEIVFDIIQLPNAYREDHFKVFQQVRKWANFIKHPKAFILTHHPTYDFVGSGVEYDIQFKETINEQFVQEFYTGQTDPNAQKRKNKELFDRLTNKRNILVLFPDIAQVTKKMCYSFNKFIDLIVKNEVYIELLKDESTISNYFENAY